MNYGVEKITEIQPARVLVTSFDKCFSKSYSMVMKLSKMLLQFCTLSIVLR